MKQKLIQAVLFGSCMAFAVSCGQAPTARGEIFRHDNFDIGRNDSEHPLGNHPWAPGHRHLPAGIGYHFQSVR